MRYFGPGARFEKNGNRMRKTRLIVLSALTLALLLVGAHAGEKPSVPRLGILIPESGRAESQAVKGLREGLRDLRHQEGKSLQIEIRDAKGDRSALKQEANELVRQKVRLIFTTGTRATQAAKAGTAEIPIVFNHPADPVALGLVKSLKRPGGNVTGVAAFSLQMTERRLQILKEMVPKARRVTIFYDANNRYSQENFLSVKKAAVKLKLEVEERAIKSADELRKSITNLQQGEGDTLFHIPDDLIESQADFIIEAAREKRWPTMFSDESLVTKGGLASYEPSYYQMGRVGARLADKILKGAKPQELPVEKAGKFDLLINLRTANGIGLSIPGDLLKRADRVIR